MTVSRASRVSHAAQSSACTREWRRRTVTRWSGHCFRRAYIATVIEVQDPSEAKSRSYGVGPVSVPPARAGSSLRKRCEPATISWAKPSAVHCARPRRLRLVARRSYFAFLPFRATCGREPPLLIPRQRCIHPGDEPSELLDVLPEELLGGLVGDAPIVGDQAAFELHVRLDGIHQR